MSRLRFKAVEAASKRIPVEVSVPDQLPSEYFGKYVFNRTQMSKYLSKETMNTVLEAIDRGTTLHREIADHVAAGMKMWAMEMGATHYTHWFQPLTEGTAEKHDSFIDYVNGPGGVSLNASPENCWLSRNLMHLVFQVAAYEILLKREDIQHGTPPPPPPLLS